MHCAERHCVTACLAVLLHCAESHGVIVLLPYSVSDLLCYYNCAVLLCYII